MSLPIISSLLCIYCLIGTQEIRLYTYKNLFNVKGESIFNNTNNLETMFHANSGNNKTAVHGSAKNGYFKI